MRKLSILSVGIFPAVATSPLGTDGENFLFKFTVLGPLQGNEPLQGFD